MPGRTLFMAADAEPNTGDFSGTGLIARMKANALDGIHTTFIGECSQNPSALDTLLVLTYDGNWRMLLLDRPLLCGLVPCPFHPP